MPDGRALLRARQFFEPRQRSANGWNERSTTVRGAWIYDEGKRIYSLEMGKHLVDIDEAALQTARARFGSETIKETVNRALRQAGGEHQRTVKRRLDVLAGADLAAREQAWR